ncbi:hypothetical protein ACS2BX_26035 [Bacillus cereus group sp. BceL300]|uniref:hypothetical protein n=1 Tax=Bacillus cereus group TaxID=86661 RepID=UPI00144454EB|nr:hypothetical protein [Bacillus cereus]MDK7480933.1 hypothetical protein [Bacillus cereus]NKW77444.1 hypothetical protein [Bacillus cereus]NKX14862.1 hypothetical protein [Bacillus cereus]
MLEIVKDRSLVQGQKVKVYVNLNQQGRFSIVDAKSGLVVAYAENVLISQAKFHVGESGRQKILVTQRKRVHAWVTGYFEAADLVCPDQLTNEIYYNPYTHEKFNSTANGEIISQADSVYFVNKRCYI